MDVRARLRAARAHGRSALIVLPPGPRPVFCLPPPREAERRPAQVRTWGTFCEGDPRALAMARAPSGAPPRRFFTQPPRFFERTAGTNPHVIQEAFAPPFIRSRPAIEGSPLIGDGR